MYLSGRKHVLYSLYFGILKKSFFILIHHIFYFIITHFCLFITKTNQIHTLQCGLIYVYSITFKSINLIKLEKYYTLLVYSPLVRDARLISKRLMLFTQKRTPFFTFIHDKSYFSFKRIMPEWSGTRACLAEIAG